MRLYRKPTGTFGIREQTGRFLVFRSAMVKGKSEVDTDAPWWSYNDFAERGGIYTNGERCVSISG